MAGIYSVYDSSVTLAGTPAKAGSYAISVTITDTQGRSVTSNELPFVIYDGNEKLSNQLTLSHCSQTSDGKDMYDMEPWAIKNFGGDEESVTVPSDLKA